MTDISEIFNTEETFDVNLAHPVTGEPTGYIVKVRPMFDRKVQQVKDKFEYWRLQQMAEKKIEQYTPEQLIALDEKKRFEILSAVIVSWDFGDASFGDLPAGAPCTDENKAYLINHRSFETMGEQIVVASVDRENFMKPQSKSALTTSQKKSSGKR